VNTTEIRTDLAIEVREASENDPVVATGYGRAVPYDDSTDLGGLAESFAPGAFDPADVIGKPFAYRHGEPIGTITGASNEADGLYIDFEILNTVQGRDAATLMRGNASKGLSVGFTPIDSVWNKAKTAVRHTRARLLEVSQTHMPAYQAAGVTEVREEPTMSDTVTTEAAEVAAVDLEVRESLAQLREHVASLEIKPEPQHPWPSSVRSATTSRPSTRERPRTAHSTCRPSPTLPASCRPSGSATLRASSTVAAPASPRSVARPAPPVPE
jgi:HK97 family phage prohead protease